MKNFARRQLLYDFHTSGEIEDIGKDFDADRFTKFLKEANVDQVTICSKCHHSWSYYPTKIGYPHPHLKRYICTEMFDAVKKAGAKAILYMPIGWSDGDAQRHPDWVARNRDGSICNSNNIAFEELKTDELRPYYLWKNMCIGGDYADYCVALEKELIEQFPTLDGLFIDILFRYNCYCPHCMKEMQEQGIDVDDVNQVQKFYDGKWYNLVKRMRDTLLEHNPNAQIFFNGGADMDKERWYGLSTHVELEDLPTAWGGYDKLPIRAKYFHRKGIEYAGMTAKFHSAWGEFGGFKNKDALKYEVAAMMSYGASVSVGDQIHPTGITDARSNANIQYAFDYAKRIEEFCFNTQETANLGVVITFDPAIDEGISKVLSDAHLDFDIVLDGENLEKYEAVLLPDTYSPDEQTAKKYSDYLKNGGKLVLFGNGGVVRSTGKFIEGIPLEYHGKSDAQTDYIQVETGLSEYLSASPFLCYDSASKVRVTDDSVKVLASVKRPYFNRTLDHFSSHYVVPYRPQNEEYPALVQGKNFLYFAHDIFKMYLQHGAQIHRDYFEEALKKIYTKPVLEVSIGSFGRTRLVWQPEKKRYVLHLLYAAPVLRGDCQILEDFPAIYDTKVQIRTDRLIRRVMLQPQNTEIPFEKTEDGIRINVDRFSMHQILVLETE